MNTVLLVVDEQTDNPWQNEHTQQHHTREKARALEPRGQVEARIERSQNVGIAAASQRGYVTQATQEQVVVDDLPYRAV